MQKDVTYIPIYKEVAKQAQNLDISQFPVDGCSKCGDLLSILHQILRGCQTNTLDTGGLLCKSGISFGRLEFGQFPECSGCESCQVLPNYKEFYGKYLEQWTHIQQTYADAQRRHLTSQFSEHENKRLGFMLKREVDRVELLRKHLLLSNSSYSGLPILAKEEDMLNRRCISDYSMSASNAFEHAYKEVIEKKDEQIAALAFERIRMEERLSTQKNLYFKDNVVSELKNKIEKLVQKVTEVKKESSAKDAIIEELQQGKTHGEGGQVVKPVIINIGNDSFKTRADAINFLSTPAVYSLAEENPDAIFYDDYGYTSRQYNKQYTKGSLTGDNFQTHEIIRLKSELKVSESDAEAHRKTIEQLRAELEMVKAKQQEDVQKASLTAHFSGDNNPFEEKFKNFFTTVGKGESCLQENVMYDAFFGGISAPEKQALLEWMHSCCFGKGCCLSSKEQKRLADPEIRSGKNLFAACLRAIGGDYKVAYKGQQNVWINIKMNDSPVKKRKAVDLSV